MVNFGCADLIPLEILYEGIPSIEAYKKLLKTSLFTEMEEFSNIFFSKYAKAMRRYSYRWTADSFHTWSREWEYPFVFSRIQKFIGLHSRNAVKALDAGSGCTFFPYYIAHVFPNCYVHCIDNDPSLYSTFKKINKTQERVEFSVNDVSSLEYEDNFFDILYCISVLEHVEDSRKVMGELKRVLKKDGLLILTFDISLDNRCKITIEEASKLLEFINKEFHTAVGAASVDLLRDVNMNNILTTTYMRDLGNKRLLPWRLNLFSFLNKIGKLQIPKKSFFDLTVLCCEWQNSLKATDS